MSLAITGGVIAGVGAIGGAAIGASASGKAASQEQQAAAKADAENRAAQAPFLAAGTQAVGQLETGLAPGGAFSTPFTMADATNSTAETYAQQQALMASQNSAAAKGGLIGSNEQAQIEGDAAGIASQYEGQAFNQWLQSRQQQMNGLQSLAGEGLSSAQNVGDTGANLTVGAGNAAAAGTVGEANAISGGVSGLTSQLTTLSKLFNPGTSTADPSLTPSGEGINLSNYNYDENTGQAINSAGDYSDRRLKRDVRRVGRTDSGIPIYTYRMKGSDGPFKMGVMADDMEKTDPRAVTKDSAGLKMLDYRRVH